MLWLEDHSKFIQMLQQKVKALPCLRIPHSNAFMIAKTDASIIGYGDIHKQKKSAFDSIEQIVRYHSGIWD